MCARFKSDPFNECSGKSICGVLEQLDVEYVESLLEGSEKRVFETKRQMMRVIGLVVRKESFVVMNDRRFVAIVC